MTSPTRDAGLELVAYGLLLTVELGGIANARTELRPGQPAEAIAEFAGMMQADLLVISTRGRMGPVRVLMGSVAEQVVRHAPCAVLVVRPEIGA